MHKTNKISLFGLGIYNNHNEMIKLHQVYKNLISINFLGRRSREIFGQLFQLKRFAFFTVQTTSQICFKERKYGLLPGRIQELASCKQQIVAEAEKKLE